VGLPQISTANEHSTLPAGLWMQDEDGMPGLL